MTLWIAWTVFMTALFAIAAMAVDRIAALLGAPRRFIWASAMIASVLLPAMLVAPSSPTASRRAQSNTFAATPPTTVGIDRSVPQRTALEELVIDQAVARSLRRRIVATVPTILRHVDPWVVPAWVVGSIALFVVFVGALTGLRRESARWREADAGMCRVLVSHDTGPAVFGFLRPRIVIPEWTLNADRSTRDLLLRHELEHMRTGDSRVVIVAALATILFPWNAALWWMSRRLRLAIEIDCDARVIRAVGATHEYGLVLLAVGDRYASALPHATSLSEPGLNLEARIHAMTTQRPRRPFIAALPYTAIALGVVTTAAWSPRPSPLARGQRVRATAQPAPVTVSSIATSRVAALPLSLRSKDKEAASDPRPAFTTHGGPPAPDTLGFDQIVIAPQPSAAAKELARTRAESVFAQIKRGGDFDKIAKRESIRRDPNGIGIDLGWVRGGDVAPVVARSLFGAPLTPALLPGEISPVIETPFGYAVLRIYQVQPGTVRTSQILIEPEIDSADVLRARLAADSVGAMLRAGLSFDALAQKYHDFADHEETGVSSFPRDSLPASYRNALRSARLGDVVVFEVPGLRRPDVPAFVVARLMSIR